MLLRRRWSSVVVSATLHAACVSLHTTCTVRYQSAHGNRDDAPPHDGTSGPSSSSSAHRTRADAGSAYEQFNAQREQFYSHSFHEKGSAHGASSSSQRTADSRDDTGERVAGRGSATAQERRQLSKHWENAFFGRVHYEQGMHDRYAAAVAAEDDERVMGSGHSTGASQRPTEGEMHANAHKPNHELFPSWREDEEAPLLEFKQLPQSLQAQYILNRLTMAERRIRYAVDYGSLSMMYQLNLGERMLREAEMLLNELGWMNDSLRNQIELVKDEAYKVKYDYDLD